MLTAISSCINHDETNLSLSQGCSRWSGWSGFSQTTISQGKNKIPFYKKKVINKSTRVIFGLVQLIIIIMIQWIEKAYDEVENNRPPTHAKL